MAISYENTKIKYFMQRRFSTSPRLVNKHFQKYSDTFAAFCELINNSLQAGSKNISIDIEYSKNAIGEYSFINQLSIKDDGHGIFEKEVNSKILKLGHGLKQGGLGVGRFAAFQMGASVTIESVGYSQREDKFSRVEIPLHERDFKSKEDISKLSIDTNEEYLEGKGHNTYYKVTIDEFYSQERIEEDRKKRLTKAFKRDNIEKEIFKHYPVQVFNPGTNFYINGDVIDRAKFIQGEPTKKEITLKDSKGNSYPANIKFFKLIKTADNQKPSTTIFLMQKNAGIDTVIGSYNYTINRSTAKLGSYYVYVESSIFDTDISRNLQLGSADPNIRIIKEQIKEGLDFHFKKKVGESYNKFTDELHKDKYYPYKQRKENNDPERKTFDQIAYYLEEEHSVLTDKDEIRSVIYPLIKTSIEKGEIRNIFENILKLEEDSLEKLNDLLLETSLDSVIKFAHGVASRKRQLEALKELVYNVDISKHVLERKELHKVVERMLWIFGEQYDAPGVRTLSDTSLAKNLLHLREKIMPYKKDPEEDNIMQEMAKKAKGITDLFLFQERIIDEDRSEVLVVELKSPVVKISNKEIYQAHRYAMDIEKLASVSQKVSFRVVLVSANFNSYTEELMAGKAKDHPETPFKEWESKSGRVEVWVVKWSELFNKLSRKLNYLAQSLELQQSNLSSILEKEFADVDFATLESKMRKKRGQSSF